MRANAGDPDVSMGKNRAQIPNFYCTNSLIR